jgi:hypothetical protein
MGLKRLQPSPETPPVTRRKPFAWGPKPALRLLGAILVILGVAWAAWCLATRPTFVAEQLAPLNALSLWELLKSGIDTPAAPIEKWVAAGRDYGELWAGVGWIAAAIGVLLFAVSFVISSPNRTERSTPDLK